MQDHCPDSRYTELDNFIQQLDITDDPRHNHLFLIESLHQAQTIFGFLPEEVQRFVASKLKIQFADVYGVVSFYSYFTMQMPGKYQISVCMGTACYVNGAQAVLEVMKEKLGIDTGETTSDGRFSLDNVRCIGACGIAPVLLINGKAFGNLTPEKASDILDECIQEGHNDTV